MLSLKIQNVAVILEMLAEKATCKEDKSLLQTCKNVLDDAADQAVDLETMPRIINCGFAKEVQL